MQIITSTTTINCDFCGNDITKTGVADKLAYLVNYDSYGQYRNEIIITFKGSIPYSPTTPDVCKECAYNAMKALIEAHEKEMWITK